MACCANTPYHFTNQSITTIAYDVPLQQQYGAVPKVQVWYRDGGTGEYNLSNFMPSIKLADGQLIIDHGGINTGFITLT